MEEEWGCIEEWDCIELWDAPKGRTSVSLCQCRTVERGTERYTESRCVSQELAEHVSVSRRDAGSLYVRLRTGADDVLHVVAEVRDVRGCSDHPWDAVWITPRTRSRAAEDAQPVTGL